MLSVRRRDSEIARYVRARAATSETCEYLSSRIRNWLRDSANRPLTNSLCARSNATSAADSSWVGCRGGGGGVGAGRGAGLTALAAATFCVVLTLETVVAFFPVAFLGATLELAFLPLAGCLAGAFFTGFALLDAARVVLEAALETVALFAFGFDADLALTARFAVFEEAFLAVARAVDLRKPFERLLLILGLISKGCSDSLSSRRIGGQLTIGYRLNQ